MEFDNGHNNKSKRSVKKMAVMTQSEKSVFIIDEDKINDFDRKREKTSSEMNYELIVRQSKQIQTQIKNIIRNSQAKDEE